MIEYDHQNSSRGCDTNGDRESLQAGIKADEIVFNGSINRYHTVSPLSFLILICCLIKHDVAGINLFTLLNTLIYIIRFISVNSFF